MPNETRNWLASSDDLRPTTMGLLRDKRYVERIALSERSASSHAKASLRACRRACGDDIDNQIMVDLTHPVAFRPDSAWPNSDIRRKSKTNVAHGDGFTFIIVTGEIRSSDGKHPDSVQFFRENDSMLLGARNNIKEDVLYDSTAGRFVFYTSVFAAFSRGQDKQEQGPYQTGSARIRIETQQTRPLSVSFYDEMPDVVITLPPQPN